MAQRTEANGERVLRDPKWVVALFSTTEYAWIWLIVRIYMGWDWWNAGWHKVTSDAWMGGGAALKGSWERMIAIPDSGRPVVTYDFYRNAIELMYDQGWWPWFAKLIVLGELAVGLALLVGALVGIAAIFGAFMNWNFAMGGLGAGTNAIMIFLAVGLLLAWKTAGWWGVDRWLLGRLGTPWQPGSFRDSPTLVPEGERPRMNPLEQWLRMIAGSAVALWAQWVMTGPLLVIVLLLCAAFVAVAGLGLFPLMRTEEARQSEA